MKKKLKGWVNIYAQDDTNNFVRSSAHYDLHVGNTVFLSREDAEQSRATDKKGVATVQVEWEAR